MIMINCHFSDCHFSLNFTWLIIASTHSDLHAHRYLGCCVA